MGAIGIAEAYRAAYGWVPPGGESFLRASYKPGQLGFDPLGLKPAGAADFKDMQTKEINNGRLGKHGGVAARDEEWVSDDVSDCKGFSLP